MKAQKRSGLAGFIVNLLIVAMIGALYFTTSGNDAVNVAQVFYSPPAYRGQAGNKAALQFAVSWNAASMESILDTLLQEGVQATFAVSGEWVQENRLLLRKMALDGHEIATMGYTPESDGKLSWVKNDIIASLDIIESVTGQRPTIYYLGNRDIAVSARAAKQLDMTHVLCTVDLLCARGGAEDIVSRVSNVDIDGSIILMQPTKAAGEALLRVIETLRSKGMAVTCTGDVLQVDG